MKLIDAERLLRSMKRICPKNCSDCKNATFLSSDEHCGLIDEQPIAYDVEKVVEELESYRDKGLVSGITSDAWELGACHAINKAIEIVKRGGENDNSERSL